MFHNLESIIIARSVYQRMPLTLEVVKLIKNNNCFNITHKFDWHPSTFKSLVRFSWNRKPTITLTENQMHPDVLLCCFNCQLLIFFHAVSFVKFKLILLNCNKVYMWRIWVLINDEKLIQENNPKFCKNI